jgi:hypothetical protein
MYDVQSNDVCLIWQLCFDLVILWHFDGFVSGTNLQSAKKAKPEFVAHYARNCSRLNLATPG